MNRRRLLFRALAVGVLAAVAAVMLVIGRGHTIYLDNKTLEYDGQTFSAPYRIAVSVEGQKGAKLNARDRGQAECIGQTFRMTLEITQTKGGEAAVQEAVVRVPYGMDGVVLNLPGYLAGLPEEAWLQEFVPIPSAEEEEEVPGEEGDLAAGEAPGEDLGFGDL